MLWSAEATVRYLRRYCPLLVMLVTGILFLRGLSEHLLTWKDGWLYVGSGIVLALLIHGVGRMLNWSHLNKS